MRSRRQGEEARRRRQDQLHEEVRDRRGHRCLRCQRREPQAGWRGQGQLHEEDLQAIRALGIEDEWVIGIPHPQLFAQFKQSICAEHQFELNSAVQEWRAAFLNYMNDCSEAEAVGAIGFGTESIVKHIYQPIIKSISTYSGLTLRDYVFFPLHTEVDDEHGKVLISIANELASQSEENGRLIKKGMEVALDLRNEFWSKLELETNELQS